MRSTTDFIRDRIQRDATQRLENQLLRETQSCQVEGDSLNASDLASQAISQIFSSEDPDSLAQSLKQQLEAQQAAINSGDLTSIEETLTNQLNVLNVMFINYSMKLNSLIQGGYLLKQDTAPQVEKLAQLVIKLQNQSAKTARTLTDLKKPRQTTFIKRYVSQQLNQLVTDGKIPQGALSVAKETSARVAPQSLGEATNAKMDTPSQTTPKPVSQEMETLEA